MFLQVAFRQEGLRGVMSRTLMRSRRQRRIEDLRLAVECLPERTKEAMLDGIEQNTIIVGAYTDRNGGVCPMLAAHRHGGRTNLLAFAKAWDRFCGAKRSEEHTSELQSRQYLVCRLLLEKKNKLPNCRAPPRYHIET